MLERKKRLAAILLAAAVCATEVFAGSLAVSAEEGQGQIGVESSERQENVDDGSIVFTDVGTDLTGMEIQAGVLRKYNGTAEEVVIPDGVTEIWESAFDECSSVKSITIPKIGDYYIGCRRVLTNIFGTKEVMAYVTSPGKEGLGRRLFFSTVFPSQMQIFCAWQEKAPLNQTGSSWM